MPMKLISVVSSCYNEEENVEPLYEAVKAIFAQLPQYEYEHILIDNDLPVALQRSGDGLIHFRTRMFENAIAESLPR